MSFTFHTNSWFLFKKLRKKTKKQNLQSPSLHWRCLCCRSGGVLRTLPCTRRTCFLTFTITVSLLWLAEHEGCFLAGFRSLALALAWFSLLALTLSWFSLLGPDSTSSQYICDKKNYQRRSFRSSELDFCIILRGQKNSTRTLFIFSSHFLWFMDFFFSPKFRLTSDRKHTRNKIIPDHPLLSNPAFLSYKSSPGVPNLISSDSEYPQSYSSNRPLMLELSLGAYLRRTGDGPTQRLTCSLLTLRTTYIFDPPETSLESDNTDWKLAL